jgi:hypothetical protein
VKSSLQKKGATMEHSTIDYKGYEIKILYDDDSESPIVWDNLGTMVCFHRKYDLGDKHDFYDPDDVREYLKQNDCIALPLYLYDHSGITMSCAPFSCPWDSGQVGIIYVEVEQVKKEWGWKRLTKKRREKIEGILRSEVETYDDYLTGNVFSYTVERFGDLIDSCCGFYGDPKKSGIIEEAKSIVDYDIGKRRKEKAERLKTFVRNHVPLEVRQMEFSL